MRYKEIAERYQKEVREVMEILNVREDTIKYVETAMCSLALEAELAGRENLCVEHAVIKFYGKNYKWRMTSCTKNR